MVLLLKPVARLQFWLKFDTNNRHCAGEPTYVNVLLPRLSSIIKQVYIFCEIRTEAKVRFFKSDSAM